MPRQRPGSVTAAAVLSIIYGSLGTLCGLCGASMLITQGALGNNFMGGNDPMQAALKKDLEAALAGNVPAYQAYQIFSAIFGLLVPVGLLVGGIALLSMLRWARTLTLICCLIGIFCMALNAFYVLVFVVPAMNKAFQVAMPAAMQQQKGAAIPAPQMKEVMRVMESMMTAIAVISAIIYIAIVIYLMIIIILLSRRHVRNAFAGVPSLDEFEDDRFDRDRGERRRDNFDDEDDDWNRPPPDDPKDDRFRV